MPQSVPLPLTLQRQLTQLERRVRQVRVFRSLVRGILLLVGLALLGIGLDVILAERLPSWWRAGYLIGWLGLGVAFTFRWLRQRSTPLDPVDLAALVERRYPALAERLTSSVELSRSAGLGSGSPALIALLLQETAAHAGNLAMHSVIPYRQLRRAVGLLAALVLLVLLPVGIFPTESGRYLSRFLCPWYNPAPLADFAIAVDPGDGYAARDHLVPIQVRLTPRYSGISLPASVQLVVLGTNDEERRFDLAAQEDRYSIAWQLRESIRYRIEAGTVISPTYTLTAVAPIELAPDSPRIRVTPPSYAASAVDAESYTGLVDFSALEHSNIAVECRFTRPVQAGWLEWADGSRSPLQLHDNGTTATLEVPARQSGPYRLVLQAEESVLIRREGGTLTIRPDQPPRLVHLAGKDTARTARPGDRVPIQARLADDIAVSAAAVQYRVNDDSALCEEALPFAPSATPQEVMTQHALVLGSQLKPGDVVSYRIRFQDNRPEALGGPNVCYYPANGWLQVRIARNWQSLRETEIQARKNEMDAELDRLRADLMQVQRRILALRQASRDQDRLDETQQKALAALQQQNRQTMRALEDLARRAENEPQLHSLAPTARSLAREEMQRADDHLRDAANSANSLKNRNQQLQEAENELSAALDKLEQLKHANQLAARDWQAQARLEELADRQQRIAEQLEQLTKNPPGNAARANHEAEELRREQERIAADLEALTKRHPALEQAMESATSESARKAGEQAAELARAQRDLARASKQTEQTRQATALRELAQQQNQLAEQAERLAKATQRAAQSIFSKPLQPEATRQAAGKLEQGNLEDGLQDQERSAKELERAARELDRAARQGADPREAARQLARLQEDLTRRTRQANADSPPLQELAKEQHAIRQAVEQLPTTPGDPLTQQRLKKIAEQLAEAEKNLSSNNAQEAVRNMTQASDQLRKLAPSLPERQANAPPRQGPLARPEQAEAMRQLAAQQRQLQEATRKIGEQLQQERQEDLKKENPVAQLAQQQQEIARQTEQLQGGDPQTTQQAQKATRQAARLLNAGDLPAAMESAAEAEKLLQQLAANRSDRATQLAQQQQQLYRELAKLAGDVSAQRGQQNARQQQLTREATELLRQMQQLAERQGAEQARLQQAASATQAAESSMQAAQRQAEQGNQAGAQTQRELAARALERAAGLPQQQADRQQVGQSLRQARDQIQQSRSSLAEKQPAAAQSAMQQAASALAKAAQQLGQTLQPNSPANPSGQPGSSGSVPPPQSLASTPELLRELGSHAGKPWGDLPGELRTRIVQQMKERYGEDYARMIKLYFEQIADTRGKR